MSATVDQIQRDLIKLDASPLTHSSDETKKLLLDKLIFLMDNVAVEHKNPLIKSKIVNQRYERFNLARSLVEGDGYFKSFLSTLNEIELQWLLASLKPGLEKNIGSDPRTAVAFNHVYHNKPAPTIQLVIDEAYTAFGNVFRDTLEVEALRQHTEAVTKNPQLMLTEHEYKQCGNPLDLSFKFYIPKLDNEVQGRFNKIIRNVLNKENNREITTFEAQCRLRFAIGKLAEVLEQRGSVQDAYNLREAVFGSRYARDRLGEYRAKKLKVNQKNKARTGIFGKMRDLIKKLTEYIRGLVPFMPMSSVVPNKVVRSTEPPAQHITPAPELVPAFKTQDLYSRFVNLQKDTQPQAAQKIFAEKPYSPITPAYRGQRNRYKKPTSELLFAETNTHKVSRPRH